ncbi:MAG: 2Fe-2S iron-sulfur cluster-binding protein, partial [Chloroflexota bacterium]
MEIQLTINGQESVIDCDPGETLFRVLRRQGLFSVRFGSDSGETGAAAVLLDGDLVSSDVLLAAQADGHVVETVEGLSQGLDLHPIQQAFVRAGAIQSGYSTPAMILAAKALLERNPDPTEEEIRDAISGILDRETGYVKPVQAIQAAAAMLRGEEPLFPTPNVLTPIDYGPDQGGDDFAPGDMGIGFTPEPVGGVITEPVAPARSKVTSDIPETSVVGKAEPKVDALKLVKGNPAFVDDVEMRGMLYAKLLTSPHAHARIIDIDDSEALALPGVHAV